MSECRDYVEMAYRSIECFSNDGVLKPADLTEEMLIAVGQLRQQIDL